MIRKITDKYYSQHKHIWVLIFMGAVIGSLVGLVATAFHFLLDEIGHLKQLFIHLGDSCIFLEILLSIIATTVMVVLSIFIVKKFAPEAGGSGIQEIEGTLKGVRKLRHRVLPTKFFSGVLSLGSGLSLGKEGPTIHMSAAIAQFFVDKFKMKKKYSNALISAASGAGLAAAFNTPMSGIIFVIEEMNRKFRFSIASIKCVIVAVIAAIVVSRAILGNPPAISIEQLSAVPQNSLWLFVVMGLCFGFFGVFLTKGIVKVANFFVDGSKKRYWSLVILVCIFFGLGVVLDPNAVGGGYIVIDNAFNYTIGIKMLLVLFIIRFIGLIFSYGTGVTGGIFAPMVALGIVFGLAFGLIVNQIFPEYNVPAGAFAVAGMSALFTATVGAPLTGIVLAIEMTWNYEMLLPLMITAVSASMITYVHHQAPIYETLLRRTLSREKKNKIKEQTKI